jgi:UDP-N-acetyl-2-amino-2-deoxyglucuronate dehydrogenase
MSAPRLRVGIVGCGKVSHLHAKALAELPEAACVAAFSRSRDKAEVFARPYGASPFSDPQRMIDEAALDAVIVCTPHPFHAESALPFLEAGIHTLVEKPLASSLADCDRLIAAARAAGCRLATVSQRRWYEPVLRMRRAIDEGKIGQPALGTVTMLGWRDQAYYQSDPWRGSWSLEGGGVLVNQAPHQLDLLLWLLGRPVELFGYWDNLNHPYIEVEDTAVAVLRFASGALGNILVSNSQKPGIYAKVHVHGRNGASVGVQTDGGAMFVAGMSQILEPPVNDLWTVPGEESLLPQWKRQDERFFASIDPTTYYHRLQIRDFLQAVAEKREPLVTGEDGRRTVELFTAIYRSQRDRRSMRFPLPPEKDRSDLDGRLVPARDCPAG